MNLIIEPVMDEPVYERQPERQERREDEEEE